ncbi:hypothetical protein [Acidianus bottle-shaped virus 3 strain ABV3]|uniref:Uncharacterized protein n=1 Tax=Acidianus bottle-shaped virus 3 strain ABV3 TaxID=1732174 RepID=A0A0N9P9A0_9VIRU|nr:hypothetical protein AVU00_gp45 [Acidianus bottle-shaped virus 3 strain ABV3]ALG96847.1 hypothetical protein [Acidianus bottle-shaped virus 3 strain ABV3]
MTYVVPDITPYVNFSESGIVSILIGVAMTVLSNAFAYLLVKAFNLKCYYGRFLGGVIILALTMLLSLSSNGLKRYRGMVLFGIGEMLVGGLDIISYAENISQPILIPDPTCSSEM